MKLLKKIEVKRGESLDEQYKDKEETDIMKSEEEKDEEDADRRRR